MSYFEDYVESGLCCESCGGFLGGDEPGFARRCAGCQPKAPRRERATLPRFNRYSIPPRLGTIQCKLCPSWVKPQGMNDHMLAKHPDIIKSGGKS